MSEKEGEVKESIARRFDRVASTYGRIGPRFFSHFGRRLVELVQIPCKAHVLDVATGRGAILYPAAERVGPYGRVVGIDLSAEMVRQTAAEIKRLALKNVEVHRMDAEQLTFHDASFDAVLCGLAIFFFPQPCRALDEMRRVLRPAGRVGITTFARDSEHLRWAVELLRSYEDSRETPAGESEGESSFPVLDTPLGLEAVLSHAGFENIQIMKEETDFIYENEEAVWSSLWRQAAHTVPQTKRERLKADVLQKIQAFKRPEGFHPPPFRVLFALVTKSTGLEEGEGS